MVRFRFRVRIYGHGFGVGLDITNYKNGKPSHGILLCDISSGKIINMCYQSFSKKAFTEMSYEVQRCMAFDSNELGYDF